ncbi:DUF1837 domain-containing protein [Luteibacter sp. CQ10]|uniref:DUF1837 domain-containing protein n=1 Tax=Luteibacter sp. CQ10 TaxID=2805821 RepID=UPI0034A149FB
MDFKLAVETGFATFGPVELHDACLRKSLLTVANDFEDGAWRHRRFHQFVWDHIAETALSASERAALGDRHDSVLSEAVKNLRLTASKNDIGRGGEIAEIVLYGLTRRHYGALAVVPKIFYKQNKNDNAKGADSVHIVVDGDNFSLWLGEAKFYSSIEDARLPSIIASIEELLRTDKLRKENAIVLNVKDIDAIDISQGLRNRIRMALADGVSLDELKPRLHVPILLLHQCEITGKASVWSDAYQTEIRNYHADRAISYFSKQLNLLGDKISLYGEIWFHLILFPVPEKESIVDHFYKKASSYED